MLAYEDIILQVTNPRGPWMALTQLELNEALRRCEQEPVQQIGHVQPYGATLVIGPKPDRLILQASENLNHFFATLHGEALGKPLVSLIGEDQLTKLEDFLHQRNQADVSVGRRYTHIVSQFPDTILDLLLSAYDSGALTVLEVEHFNEVESAADACREDFNKLQEALWTLTRMADFEHYFNSVATLVKGITGFDRVMVYRFDPNWDGEVIAEARNEVLPSYLGSRFPASDIPPQARALYTRNLIRAVADIDAESIAIRPVINPLTQAPLDMSFSRLRSLSPIHIEYLRNMDVRASLSISLLQQGQLWGLIACHHHEPRRLAAPVFDTLEFLSRMISMWLSVLEAHQQEVLGSHLSELLADLMKQLAYEEMTNCDLESLLGDMLGLLGAGGVLLINAGTRLEFGSVPPTDALDGLLHWLEGQPAAASFHTHYLASLYPPASDFSHIASGLLVSPFQQGVKNCALWFRPDKPKNVRWAGRPEKIVVHDREQGLKISPRTSFSTWSETWHERSEFWTQRDVFLAETLSYAFALALTRKDDVTGLPNRSYFKDRAYQAISRAVRNRAKLALVFVDLDGFKQINDKLGHQTGDAVLKEVARRLRLNLRTEDSLARWGGDEFVLLLEDITDLVACQTLVERIRETLTEPIKVGMTLCNISGSFGIATYPQDTDCFDELLAKADAAMYRAKHNGGNRMVACAEC